MSSPPLRVAIIDDSADILESLSMVIRVLGHESECCADGETGLECITRWRPHLALVDVSLPGLSGYDVARGVRALDAAPSPVLIAMTGWSREQDRVRVQEAGFDRHVVKPLDFAQLRTILAEIQSSLGKPPTPG